LNAPANRVRLAQALGVLQEELRRAGVAAAEGRTRTT
jgi:hypothetical protein